VGLVLGGCTQIRPLYALVAIALASVSILAWRASRDADWSHPITAQERRVGVQLVFVPVIAFAVFVAVYPFLWPDPIERGLLLIETRLIAMDVQAQKFPERAITTRMEAIRSMRDALAR